MLIKNFSTFFIFAHFAKSRLQKHGFLAVFAPKTAKNSPTHCNSGARSFSASGRSVHPVEPTNRQQNRPTDSRTDQPTAEPTNRQQNRPTNSRTDQPTAEPTNQQQNRPTNSRTDQPTAEPTNQQQHRPTDSRTDQPTAAPKAAPISRIYAQPTARRPNAPKPRGRRRVDFTQKKKKKKQTKKNPVKKGFNYGRRKYTLLYILYIGELSELVHLIIYIIYRRTFGI